MNKIKIIYDVVRKMKEKDLFKGTLILEGLKDQLKTFSLKNAFERNTQTGQTKAKTNVEVDCEGKKMKLENSIDFESEGGCRHGFHDFMRHMHHHDPHPGGIKDGLGRITAVLGILSSIRVDEQEDKSVILSLNSTDIPEDIRNGIHEKMQHGCEHHKHIHGLHEHHLFLKEIHTMDKAKFTLNVFISKDREIEKVTIEVNGEQKDEKDNLHNMKLSAELLPEQ